MGKELKITVKDRHTIILDEDGKAGDYIDLSKIQNFDNSEVLKSIQNGTDKLYNEELNKKEKELKKLYESEINEKISKKELEIRNFYEEKITELKESLTKKDSEYKSLNDSMKDKIELEKNKISSDYNEKINLLNNKINEKDSEYKALNDSMKDKIELEKNKISSEYNERINLLNNKINEKDNENKLFKANLETELLKQKNELDEKHRNELEEKNKEIDSINESLAKLKFEKSLKSTKEVGEDLEKWCNDEYQKYSLAFTDCKFYKDNKAEKDEDGTNGSKADFIFEVYSTEDKNDEDLLASVCLEMKNESVDNISKKKKNSDHYAKLDKDRIKKNCEYALLVSTLEWENENDAVIRKVEEYKNMYVVRPQYFIPFLAMLRSLTNKYKYILNDKKKEALTLKSKQAILEEFEDLKETYVRKPLLIITSRVTEIINQAKNIENCASAIKDQANEIISKYVEKIDKKIDTYDAKMNTLSRKVDKINEEE